MQTESDIVVKEFVIVVEVTLEESLSSANSDLALEYV
jgi:hypothetical protein